MKFYSPMVWTPKGNILLAGATMTDRRERELARETNARAFFRAFGRAAVNAAEVSAWVREVLV